MNAFGIRRAASELSYDAVYDIRSDFRAAGGRGLFRHLYYGFVIQPEEEPTLANGCFEPRAIFPSGVVTKARPGATTRDAKALLLRIIQYPTTRRH